MAPDLSDGRSPGDIIAVGTRATGTGRIELAEAPRPGEPTLRWRSHAHSIDEIEKELARIWAQPPMLREMDGGARGSQAAARTSVMNLVVVARAAETGERAAETISRLTGRHPSRTLIILTADPDGPPWLEARIQAHCVLPRAGAPETCSEVVYLTAGGETGQHLGALVTPLLIHDLPVTTWWPGETLLDSAAADEILAATDRLVVDSSTWSGDGLARLASLASTYDRFPRLSIRDFASVRQARWREAIASVFDVPEFLPFLGSIRRVSVAYATADPAGTPGSTNVTRPLYHVAWLASRLGLRVVSPLAPVASKGPAKLRPGERPQMHRGLAARLRDRTTDVGVVIRPVASSQPPGSTVRVEVTAERRGSELRVDITGEADAVHVHTWLDGVQAVDRTFVAARSTDVDLLGEAIDSGGRDPVMIGTLCMAAELAGPGVAAGA